MLKFYAATGVKRWFALQQQENKIDKKKDLKNRLIAAIKNQFFKSIDKASHLIDNFSVTTINKV